MQHSEVKEALPQPPIQLAKQQLRTEVKRRRATYTAAQLDALSARALTQLQRHPRYNAAQRILLFHSLPDEPNTHELIATTALRAEVLLPVCLPDGTLQLRPFHGETSLHLGAFHISEPTTPPFTDYAAIDLAVIPGVAFSPSGCRLGRGRGYYDRLLAHPAFKRVYKIGLALPFQLFESIPTKPHDAMMNEVITGIE